VLTANLAARLHSPVSVAIGATLALYSVAALAAILVCLGVATGILAIIG
jgi:hypothetical protein